MDDFIYKENSNISSDEDIDDVSKEEIPSFIQYDTSHTTN